MDCNDIKSPAHLVSSFRSANDLVLQRVLRCFSVLFESKFISMVRKRCIGRSYAIHRQEELASDAFNRGLLAFYTKVKENGYEPKASVETAFYFFALLQLKAILKPTGGDPAKPTGGDPGEIIGAYADTLEDYDSLQQEAAYNERLNRLNAGLALLDEDSRNLVIWRKLLKLKDEEIAARSGLQPVSVANEVHKALKKLKKIIRQKESTIS